MCALVTGVQTCALPICGGSFALQAVGSGGGRARVGQRRAQVRVGRLPAQQRDLALEFVGDRVLAVQANQAQVAVDRAAADVAVQGHGGIRSEEHTSELQSLMRNSYAVFCLNKKNTNNKLS